MSQELQPYLQQFDQQSWTLSTVPQQKTINLKDLEQRIIDNRYAHLLGFMIELKLTPTFTTAPTLVGNHACISDIEFSDGQDVLFKGDGNALRMFERLENGGNRIGDVLAQTSTNPRFMRKFLMLGPTSLDGNPTDFARPAAEFVNGYLKLTCSALTDISADTTVATLTADVAAIMAPYDELKFPAKYQRKVDANTGTGMKITGEAAYAFLAAVKNSTYGSFVSNDFGRVTVRTGRNRVVANVDAEVLAAVYNGQFARGSLDQVQGEPRDATYDVNARQVNQATPTALAAGTPDLQPVLWMPPSSRLSKLTARVSEQLIVDYAGSLAATAFWLSGRFLPHQPDSVDQRARKVAATLDISGGKPTAKTLSKKGVRASPMAKYWTYSMKAAG